VQHSYSTGNYTEKIRVKVNARFTDGVRIWVKVRRVRV
jgi:hypothetical protein